MTAPIAPAVPGTPLPWLVHVEQEMTGFKRRSVYICTEQPWPDGQIARVNTMDGYSEQADNAAYIVEACNAYPALQAHTVALAEALAEAREALHFHYTEWDGEPEDAVPLQLARSKCDAVLAAYQASRL